MDQVATQVGLSASSAQTIANEDVAMTASTKKRASSRSQTREASVDIVNESDVAGRHGSGARAPVRAKALSMSPTRRTRIQQSTDSQARASDPEADSRSSAAGLSLNFGSEATSGLCNPVAIEQARAYADLAAELDVMKVKVQALEQRVDPHYAGGERLITVKCQ